MWNKLFRRDILNPNFFSLPKSLSIGEDIVANLQIAQKASFVSIIPYAGYHYIINPNSAMHKRKVSYESKTLFFSEIDRVLGDLFNDYIQEIWHLRMKYVRSLVSNNVTIPKDSTWYNWLKENAKIINYKNINEKLLLSGLSYSMKRHVIHMIDRIHYIKMKSKGGNYI